MGEPNMSSFENAEGQAMRMKAEGYRETLKDVLNSELRLEELRADAEIGDAGVALLSKCQNPESYIAMGQDDRDAVDALMLKIEAKGEAS